MAIVVKKVNLPKLQDVKNLYDSLRAEVPANIMNTFSEENFNSNLLDKYLQEIPSKADIIRSWFQRFNITENSPGIKLYNAGWHGMVAGSGLALSLGIIPLPISIMMNANIHHHPAMRFLMGSIGLTLWPFVLIYALIFMRGRPYFGLFPLFRGGAALPPNPEHWYDWPVWIFVNLGSIVAIALSPLTQATTHEDEMAYRDFLANHLGLLDRGSEGTVPEDLYQKARDAAKIKGPAEWAAAINSIEDSLKSTGQVPLGRDVVTVEHDGVVSEHRIGTNV